MSRENSPVRKQKKNEDMERQIKQLFDRSISLGVAPETMVQCRKAVFLWNLKDQWHFLWQVLPQYKGLSVEEINRVIAASDTPFLGVLATLLIQVRTGNGQAIDFFTKLSKDLTVQQLKDVFEIYLSCTIAGPDFYVPWFDARIRLCLPGPLRDPCHYHHSFSTFWNLLPDSEDGQRKYNLCARWFLDKAAALKTNDQIYENVVHVGACLGKQLKNHPDFPALAAAIANEAQ
jgi:hypothetical protein